MIRKALRNTDGVAAIEFSLVAPIVITALLCGAEYGRAISIERRLTLTTRTVVDLAAQTSQLTAADDATVLNASAQVMAPYDTADLTIVLSEVSTDLLGVSKVVWSKPLHGTALPKGSVVSLPAGSVQPGTFSIYGQSSYTYKPVIGGTLIKPFTMTDQIVMSPRKSTSVDQV